MVHLGWDTNTAVAVIVLGALVALWLIAKGFRGFRVGITA